MSGLVPIQFVRYQRFLIIHCFFLTKKGTNCFKLLTQNHVVRQKMKLLRFFIEEGIVEISERGQVLIWSIISFRWSHSYHINDALFEGGGRSVL